MNDQERESPERDGRIDQEAPAPPDQDQKDDKPDSRRRGDQLPPERAVPSRDQLERR